MALSTITKNMNDGSLALADGTGTPVTLNVILDTGDFTVSGQAAQQSAVVKYETRGELNSVRHTTRTYPTGSFTMHAADYSDGTDQTTLDFLLQQNSFSGNLSTQTNGADADVYTIDMTWTIAGIIHGDATDSTCVMTDVHVTVDTAEGDPNTISASFEVLGTVTWT